MTDAPVTTAAITTALVRLADIPSDAEVLAQLLDWRTATVAELAGAYSDLHKNDYGWRDRAPRSRFAMALWLARRPRRACGYEDPAQYADDLAWSAEAERQHAADHAAGLTRQAADAALAALDRQIGPDWDLGPNGRVRFYA